jgi:hypothetical protein
VCGQCERAFVYKHGTKAVTREEALKKTPAPSPYG